MQSIDYTKIFEASPNEIYVFDAHTWYFIEVNKGGRDNLGYSMDELRHMTPLDLKPTYTVETFNALVAPLRMGAVPQIIFETYHLRKDGSRYPVEVHLHMSTLEGSQQVFVAMILDITQREQIQSELRASEQRLNIAQATAHLGSWELNLQDGTTYWSDEFFRICGLAPQSIIPTVELGFSLIHPEDRERAAQAVSRSQESGQPYHIEKRIVRPNGQIRWVVSQGEVQLDAQGKPWRLSGTFLDITERKRIEEDLREKHAELEQFFSLSLDLMCIATTDGYFLRVNEAWESILGYSAAELEGTFLLDMLHPEDRNATANAIMRLNAQESISKFVNRYRCKGGDYRQIEWASQPHGKLIYAVGRDVTERNEMEHTLRQSEERYRILVEHSQNAISLHRPDGTFLYVNPSYLNIFGYTQAELFEMTTDALRGLVHPQDLKRTHEEAHKQALEGKKVNHLEYRALTKAGTYIEVEAFATPIHDQHGKVTQILSSIRNITEQKQAKQREFDIALEKERVRLLRQFVESASHEFRTPLATINTSVQIMKRTDDPARRDAKAAQIQQQVERITKLVDSILKVTQLESGTLKLSERVKLADVLEMVYTELNLNEAQQARLHTELAPNLPAFVGDLESLVDALKAIVDNALTFGRQTVTVRGSATATHLSIEVHDDGEGIAQDDLPHIFNTFWRRDKAHSTPGLGLGLTIAQTIVQQHGGSIHIETQKGVGTCFRVVLPLQAQLSLMGASATHRAQNHLRP